VEFTNFWTCTVLRWGRGEIAEERRGGVRELGALYGYNGYAQDSAWEPKGYFWEKLTYQRLVVATINGASPLNLYDKLERNISFACKLSTNEFCYQTTN